jgi:hypothetical protein
MSKRNQHKDQVRGFVSGRAQRGDDVITRPNITEDFGNYWRSLGLCPERMARGGDTSKIMKAIATDYGYTFRFNGKDAQGRYINPRLVKIGYIEV